jgi:tRNA(fMet)-specific endonuclease VapC
VTQEALLLDTNILVHLVRRDRVGLQLKTEYDLLLREPRPVICAVTEGELRSLVFQFGWGRQKAEQARYLLRYFQRIPIEDENVFESYAVVDAYSESTGHPMGKNDLWIAAVATSLDLHLLTTDRDFDHLIPDFLKATRIKIA